MSLAGARLLRPICGGAFGGLLVLVLLSRLGTPHLPAQAPPPTIPIASRVIKSAAVAPSSVRIQAPSSHPIRTVPVYIPTAMLPPPEPKPVVMPVVLAQPVIAPAPKPKRLKLADLPRKPYRRASLGLQKPAGRFARFCSGSGRDRHSWMKISGRKRYCK